MKRLVVFSLLTLLVPALVVFAQEEPSLVLQQLAASMRRRTIGSGGGSVTNPVASAGASGCVLLEGGVVSSLCILPSGLLIHQGNFTATGDMYANGQLSIGGRTRIGGVVTAAGAAFEGIPAFYVPGYSRPVFPVTTAPYGVFEMPLQEMFESSSGIRVMNVPDLFLVYVDTEKWYRVQVFVDEDAPVNAANGVVESDVRIRDKTPTRFTVVNRKGTAFEFTLKLSGFQRGFKVHPALPIP